MAKFEDLSPEKQAEHVQAQIVSALQRSRENAKKRVAQGVFDRLPHTNGDDPGRDLQVLDWVLQSLKVPSSGLDAIITYANAKRAELDTATMSEADSYDPDTDPSFPTGVR